MNNPKITIITATYNNESTIEDSIQSVVNQSYQNIEYIIIDGNSTDNTLKIIEKYKSKISKLISEADKGIYDALNKGILAATGDVIGFLHGDDLYENTLIIEKVAKLFENEKTDSVYGDLLYVSKENISKTIRYWNSGEFSFSKLKKGWMPPHPTFFVKKSIYDNFGNFDISFRIAADYDSILRFLGTNKISVVYLPEVLIKMRIGGESNKSIKNIIRKMKEDIRALKKNRIGGLHTVFFKNIRKIPQLFIKK